MALGAALVLSLASVAIGADPATEAAIRAQDDLLAKGDRAGLLRQAKDALARDESARNRYLLGRVYGLIDELEKAREQFEWAIEKDPAFAYPYLALGTYYHVKQNEKEAERNFLLALRLDDRLSRARAQLGKLYVSRGDLDLAQREFLKVLDFEPDDVEVRNLLAHVHLKRKNYDLAIVEFRSVLGRQPGEPSALKGLALALSFAKRTAEAIPVWRRVIKALPKDIESYVFLKNLLMEKEDRAGAVEILKALRRELPQNHPLLPEIDKEVARLEGGGDMRPAPRSLEDLIAELDAEDVGRRRDALRIFKELQVVPPPKRLVQEVSTKYEADAVCRVMAVQILGATGGKNTLGLFEVLLVTPKDRDPDEHVRGAVAAALGMIKTDAAIPVLLSALDDESLYVFRLAVESLRRLTGFTFTEDPNLPIEAGQRAEIAGGWASWWRGTRSYSRKLDALRDLVEQGNVRLLKYLVPMLDDSEPGVAGPARDAFGKLAGIVLGTPELLETPAGRAQIRKLGAEAYEKLRGPR